jgi:hypothetical protein
MLRRPALACALLLSLPLAAPLGAQAPQFRAEVTQTGDTSFDGTFYFGNGRIRIEGVADGEDVTAIVDGPGNRMIVLMPEDEAYLTMDLGSAPFSAPAASPMDPANPCSSGEVSDCRNLGTENVNGYAARGWEYTRDGERETAWIATELRFPVRTIEADGTTTDFTNVQLGAQPAALFQPPAGWTEMDMAAMLGGLGGGFGGRGAAAGRGQVPPAAGGRGQAAGRGAVPPAAAGRGAPAAGRGAPPAGAPGGVDAAAAAQLEAQLRAMGLPPDQIAMALGQLNAAVATQGIDYSAWEAGDGWVVELVVTASHSESGTSRILELTDPVPWSSTYSARFTASVPFTYGTPGAAGMGPAWQLLPGAGSPRGEREPIRFSGTSEYRREQTVAQNCGLSVEGRRLVTVARGTGSTNTTDAGTLLMAQARWELSGDLATHRFQAGAAATEANETAETTNTITARCPNFDSESTREQSTRTMQMGILVNLGDLPLPASPQTMRGTATAPMMFDVNGIPVEIEANVEWTLRPIQ